ncbi:MoaD/ThiS family protein [Baekduia soli]|nr:MoaD/ThiS family protein [Baekduia soli]
MQPAGSDAGVTVEVRLGPRLGPGRRTVALRAGATVADLVAVLAPDLGVAAARLDGVAVAVDGEVVGRGRALRDGETLALVLPVAGG